VSLRRSSSEPGKFKEKRMSKILVIPDVHACSDTDMRVADKIGEAIVTERPDVVVCLGDLFDLDSLSDWKALDARSYKADVRYGVEFQKRLWAPAKRAKKKMPRRVLLEGNHEYRAERYLRANPEMRGFVDLTKDFKLKKYWDEVVPYAGETPGVIDIEGVLFAHFLPGGVMGKAVSGIHAAHSLNMKYHQSCVVGHSHTFDHKVGHLGVNGQRIMSTVAGCAFLEEHNWAGSTTNTYYDRGFLVLNNVEEGEYDLTWRSLS